MKFESKYDSHNKKKRIQTSTGGGLIPAECLVLFADYHQISNIRPAPDSKNWTCLVLQLSLSNPLMSGVKSRIEM